MGTERKLTERSRYTADYDTETTGGPANQQIGPCLLPPQEVAVGGPYYTTTIDMGQGATSANAFEKALICVLGGAAGGQEGTLTLDILQCTGPAATPVIGAGAKVLAGLAGTKAITDSAMGSYSYSGYYYYNMNRKWLLEIDVEEMDVDAGFRYLQVRYTIAGKSWFLAMEAERSLAHYEACAQTNIDQVVA